MILELYVSLVLLSMQPGDTAAMVQRLGSGRYTEREAAAEALRTLGRDALPALREARSARDPEVRVRATALADQIEASLLVLPTFVRLDFKDAPLDRVVKELARRGGLNLALHPSYRERLAARQVTLESTEPLPAWVALDRLCKTAGLLTSPGFAPDQLESSSDTQGLLLYDGRGYPGAPTCNAGPFRIEMLSSHYQRDRLFKPNPDDPDVKLRSEQCQLQLQVVAEPRLMVSQDGPVRLLEAIDERGQSLLPPSIGLDRGLGDAELFGFGSGSTLVVPTSLMRPESAGRRISLLRGEVPLLLAARRPEPLVIPLEKSSGRSFQGDHLSVTVHSLRSDPDEPQHTIELSIRAADGLADDTSAFAPEFLTQHLDVADSRGKPFLFFPMEITPRDGEIRLTLLLHPSEGAGRPERLQLFSLQRVEQTVNFEFRDIEMP